MVVRKRSFPFGNLRIPLFRGIFRYFPGSVIIDSQMSTKTPFLKKCREKLHVENNHPSTAPFRVNRPTKTANGPPACQGMKIPRRAFDDFKGHGLDEIRGRFSFKVGWGRETIFYIGSMERLYIYCI